MTPRSLRLSAVALATLLLLTPAGNASAQDEDAQEQAAKLYKEGVEAYFAADYAVAISKLRQGYQLDPNAMFLYTISLSFSKLGNFEEALLNAHRAEELGGMPDDVTTRNRGRLAAFSVLVSSEAIATALAEPALTEPAVATCATDQECDEGEICNIRRGVCVASLVSVPEPKEKRLLGTPGWIGIGIGAVGVTATVVAVVISAGLSDDIEEYDRLLAADDPEAETLRASIAKRQSTGRIMLFTGIGGMALGAGLIAYDLLFTGGDASNSALVPVVSPDGAGFVWRARF